MHSSTLRGWTALVIVLLVRALSVFRPSAQELPAHVGKVNDFAEVLDAAQRAELETQLADLERATSAEVAVVTMRTLGARTLEGASSSRPGPAWWRSSCSPWAWPGWASCSGAGRSGGASFAAQATAAAAGSPKGAGTPAPRRRPAVRARAAASAAAVRAAAARAGAGR